MKRTIAILSILFFSFNTTQAQQQWISLFNGKDLTGWTSRGTAQWTVKDGVILGQNGQGHLYAAPVVKDFEVKGEFKVLDQGKGANSGFYVRANEPANNPEGFPRGYEAQILNSTDAHTGWLWKPGKPTGKATALLTKDGEWFAMRVKVTGDSIFIWVKEQLVMTYRDDEYKEGKFAIQCHNPGMSIEARNLYYRKLD